jgi:hypothetical protein
MLIYPVKIQLLFILLDIYISYNASNKNINLVTVIYSVIYATVELHLSNNYKLYQFV